MIDSTDSAGDDPADRTRRRHRGAMLRGAARTLLLAFAIVVLTAAAGSAQQPNIVVILADDLGYGDTGFTGGTQIRTPNIDALAETGVVLTSGYAASSVCSPSRAGLMTGRYPQRFGHENNPPKGVSVGLPLTELTIADVLGAAGYRTALIGKWHLGTAPGYQPNSRGFDEFYGLLASASDYRAPVTLRRNAARVVERRYVTTALGEEAADFVDVNRTRPFFLYLAFNAPHAPLQAMPEHLRRYPDIRDRKRRTYAAMVSALDDAVGEVAAALKRNGLDRNTLLFFMSDNGGATWMGGNNSPLRGAKSQIHEGGLRVPMFVRWPAQLRGGQRYDRPVISLDVLPTAAAAAGVRVPGNLDGVDLLPYLRGERAGAPHRALFWRLGGGTAAERSAALIHSMKLSRHARAARAFDVFDLASDPAERRDIATPALLADLREEYRRWESQMMLPRW